MYNRRNFLKQSALLGSATLLPAGLSATEHLQFASRQKKPVPPTKEIDTYTVNMSHVRAVSIPPRQIIIPDVEGFKVLKGDFHIHTIYSDGNVRPHERVADAAINGLDAISITDHFECSPNMDLPSRWAIKAHQGANYNIGYEAAKRSADKLKLLLVRGGEITKKMPPGHFNALFTEDNNPIGAVQHTVGPIDSLECGLKMLEEAAKQGAFLIWNHPGWKGQVPIGQPLKFSSVHEEIWKNGWMHGIEIYNGAIDEYYPIVSDWANERDLALFANSDNHPTELDHYGIQNPHRPITLALATERTLASLKEAMFAKRTIAWAGGLLWGRDPWLPALFKASVLIKPTTRGVLELTNISSLPVSVSVGGAVIELPKDIKREIYRAEGLNSLTVANWMIGMNKPLEINIE
jgi:histidinol phosphatase-like PHP family hydrolase